MEYEWRESLRAIFLLKNICYFGIIDIRVGDIMSNNSKLKEFVKKVEDRTNDVLDDSLMDDDAKEENFNINYTDIVKNNAKARMSKLPWLISIFLILIIAIMLGFMFFRNNPKTLFTSTIDGMFNYLKSSINDNVYDVMDGNISLEYFVNTKEDLLSKDLNGMNLSADYVKDNLNSQIYMDVNLGKDIPMILYSDGSNSYVSLLSFSEKYIKMNSNPLGYFIGGADSIIILNGLNQAIDKSAANEKIYASRENIDINGNKVKAYVMKLVVDNKNRDRVIETFINTLKANDEFTSVLARVKGVSNEDVRNFIQNYLVEIKDELKKEAKLEILLYVDNKTNEFLKMDINGKKESLSLINNDDKYIYSKNNEDGSLESGDFVFTFNESKTKYTLEVNYKKTLNGSVLTESKINLKFTSKKANKFKENEVIDNIHNNEMNELEKLDVYSKLMNDNFFSKILFMVEKMV